MPDDSLTIEEARKLGHLLRSAREDAREAERIEAAPVVAGQEFGRMPDMAAPEDPRRRQPFGLPWPHPTEEITLENVDEVMRYQGWDADQAAAGDVVREAIAGAVKAILRHVPRSPRRTLAVQHLISARMDANAAISFRGRF